MPRTKETFEAMRQITREKIEITALSLFARRGLSVKVGEIAKAAGVSQGLMYSHYSSKDELILELIKQAVTISSEYIMNVATSEKSAVEKIKNITEIMCEMFSNAPIGIDYFMFMAQVGMSSLAPKDKVVFNEQLPNPAEILAGIIIQGLNENTVVRGDPFQLSITYWAVIQGLCGYAITGMPLSPEPMMLNRILIKENLA